MLGFYIKNYSEIEKNINDRGIERFKFYNIS